MKTLNHILYVLDYVYYRTFHWYKDKKDSQPGVMAVSVVTLLVLLSFLTVLIFIAIFFSWVINIQKWQSIILTISVLSLTMYRYAKISINKLDLRWKNEAPKKKKRRGWTIFLVLAGELLFIIISSYIRHNIYGSAKFFQ
jgi:accessory gene regulator protein AgrB